MNKRIRQWFQENETLAWDTALDIWNHPEIAYEEIFACHKIAAFLETQGFTVSTFSVGSCSSKPNALRAVFGSGKPVIGILGELDALPGLGQSVCAHEEKIPGPGHGCGHNLLGAGCAAAAAAAKAVMEAEHLTGTIVYFGCPAEEVIAGKVLMASMGCFDNLDLCMTWHPGGGPGCLVESVGTALTNITFTFEGTSAHAADAPWKGRSALDAAELMNVASQYLREHITPDARLHYCYRAAGEAPNVVPDYASVNYFIRAKSRKTCDEIVERVKDNARGAALMTGTHMGITEEIGCYEFLVNHTLNRYAYQAMCRVPDIEYTPEERVFAKELYENVFGHIPENGANLLPVGVVHPSGVTEIEDGGSTDVADVTQICPTVNTFGFGAVSKIPGHHWGITACSGSSIGCKGMIYSAMALAELCYDALTNKQLVQECQEEFHRAKAHMDPYYSHIAGKSRDSLS